MTRIILEQARGTIDSCVGAHGGNIIACCFGQLAGGNTALQQPFTDLLHATIFEVISQSELGNNNTVAHQWVFEALKDESNLDNDVKGKIMNLIFSLVRGGGGALDKKKFNELIKVSGGVR